jgi:DNA-binding response OmpR family regulator
MRSARDSAPPLPTGGATVLVVDGDAVTRRFVELALAPEQRLHVETAATAAAAIDLMRTTPCDLIVTEARLPDLDGLDLVRRLRGRGVGHELTIMVLSADERVERKVAAFAAGADDYLGKPCALDELRARVVRRLRRRFAERAERQRRVATLAGQLSAMPLPDLVGVLAMGGKPGTLEIHTDRG